MQKKRPSLVQLMGMQSRTRVSARTKMGAKWLQKVKKGQVAPKGQCRSTRVSASAQQRQCSSEPDSVDEMADGRDHANGVLDT